MSARPAGIHDSDGAVAPSQLFVINLCASTSPMALVRPTAPELKRYNFFVSRQREEGRERFRLHMGYFAAQDEAERLLEAVRDIYPAAWVGAAPSSGRLRRKAVAEQPAAESPPVRADVLDTMSNVRDVLAELSQTPAPVVLATPDVATPELSEPQVLGLLDGSAPAPQAAPEAKVDVRLVTPEDTQTLADIRSDAASNAPPCFAVQLVWSMSPINMADLPQLAVFDHYTLYNVEGSRQGRKWYGLRLGFFSEQTAAAQVAGHVRSEYRAVAIVPVTTREHDSAAGESAASKQKSDKPAAGAPLRPVADLRLKTEDGLQGFELLANDQPPPGRRDIDGQAAAAGPNVPVAMPVTRGTGKPTGKRVQVRKRPVAPPRGRAAPGAPAPLESTLEILGASTLTLDDGGRATINDSAIRKPLENKPAGGSRFARLLGRLGGG